MILDLGDRHAHRLRPRHIPLAEADQNPDTRLLFNLQALKAYAQVSHAPIVRPQDARLAAELRNVDQVNSILLELECVDPREANAGLDQRILEREDEFYFHIRNGKEDKYG